MTPVSFEVSLFGDPRIEARLPAPRGLSQVTTSFIGSWCLGIHRLPLVACYFTTKMLASTVQFSRNGRAQVTNPSGGWIGWSARRRCARQPTLQDPTACLGFVIPVSRFHSAEAVVLTSRLAQLQVNAPLGACSRTGRSPVNEKLDRVDYALPIAP